MVPGPGKYEHEKAKTYRSLNWTGQSQREVLKVSEKNKLGPGIYTTKAPFGEGPKHSFHNKLPEQKKLDVPGPGFYKNDISAIKDNTPKWK